MLPPPAPPAHRNRPAQPLKTQLAQALALASGVSMLLVFLILSVYDAVTLQRDLLAQVDTVAGLVLKDTRVALAFNDESTALESLEVLRDSPIVVLAEVRTPDGAVFAARRDASAPLGLTAAPGQFGNGWNRRLSQLPIVASNGTELGELRLYIDLAHSALVRRTAGHLLLLVLALVVAAGWTRWLAGRYRNRLAQPIETMAAQASQIAEREAFAQDLLPQGNAESVYLARAFNRVLAQVRSREERLQHQASTDALTGLANRPQFKHNLQAALADSARSGEAVALLFLDLDNFKYVNDALGHGVGDDLLRHTAQRLTEVLPDAGRVSRLGGDEFTIILPGCTTADQAGALAESLVRAFQQPVCLPGHDLYTAASIGVALYPQDADDADTLVRHADIAMYAAKRRGRANYQFFTPAMGEESRRRMEVESCLRGALDRGEIWLAYQPKVDLASGRLAGCEVLARWTHPRLGTVTPAEFIPVCEDNGLIVPLGRHVLRAACQQAMAWSRWVGHPLPVAVNVSIRQLRTAGFVADVLAALRDSGLPPEALELELTESGLMENIDDNVRKLAVLRETGVRIAIDDFGTGYSSMTQLERIPATCLKVDRAFVNGIDSHPKHQAIVRAIFELAQGLGMQVVVEGVERRPDLDWLGHCGLAQGYLFAAPLAAEAFARLPLAGYVQPAAAQAGLHRQALV